MKHLIQWPMRIEFCPEMVQKLADFVGAKDVHAFRIHIIETENDRLATTLRSLLSGAEDTQYVVSLVEPVVQSAAHTQEPATVESAPRKRRAYTARTFKPQKCKKCQELFNPTGPTDRTCPACRNGVPAEVETPVSPLSE